MTKTTLFQNSESTVPATITLSDDISAYDEIIITMDINGYLEASYFPVSAMGVGVGLGVWDDGYHTVYTYTSDRLLTLHNSTHASGAAVTYVIGVKW